MLNIDTFLRLNLINIPIKTRQKVIIVVLTENCDSFHKSFQFFKFSLGHASPEHPSMCATDIIIYIYMTVAIFIQNSFKI